MMADTEKNDSTGQNRQPESTDQMREPLSDSALTAIERVVRDQYRPNLLERSSRPKLSDSLSSILDSKENIKTIWETTEDSAQKLKELMHFVSTGFDENTLQSKPIERSIAKGSTAASIEPANRFILGTEFAIVAIVAVAGLTKRRADLSFAGLGTVNEAAGSDQAGGGQRGRQTLLYQSPRFNDQHKNKMPKEKSLRYGITDDTPEWMVSLDGSTAAEAGYLYASVLKRPKILMTQSDTLTTIAEKHFQDGLLGWLIADLNLKRVREIWKDDKRVIAISNGESIELPVWEDIVEFYQNKPKLARADNLITVVLKRNLDRELLELELAAIIGDTADGA